MKTSNKLLLGFLIFLVALPLLLLMSFRMKLASNQFVVRKYDWTRTEDRAKGFASNGKIQIEAVGLTRIDARIYTSDTAEYSFHNDGPCDSIHLQQQPDGTMRFVMTCNQQPDPDSSIHHKDLAIGLPTLDALQVTQSDVEIRDLPILRQLLVDLQQHAELRMGRDDDRDENKPVQKFGPLQINSANSTVELSNNTAYSRLWLNLSAGTQLNANGAIQIDSIGGQITDDVQVKMAYKYLRQLKPLTTP